MESRPRTGRATEALKARRKRMRLAARFIDFERAEQRGKNGASGSFNFGPRPARTGDAADNSGRSYVNDLDRPINSPTHQYDRDWSRIADRSSFGPFTRRAPVRESRYVDHAAAGVITARRE